MDRQAIEARREYMREYMREYRARKDKQEQLKEYTNRYWLGRATVEVRSLPELERELEQLKYRA